MTAVFFKSHPFIFKLFSFFFQFLLNLNLPHCQDSTVGQLLEYLVSIFLAALGFLIITLTYNFNFPDGKWRSKVRGSYSALTFVM